MKPKDENRRITNIQNDGRQIVEYCEFLNEILKIGPDVRFVGMYNSDFKK